MGALIAQALSDVREVREMPLRRAAPVRARYNLAMEA
jgi:hypothetical protein